MIFSSIYFIFVFLPIVCALYFIVPGKVKNIILLLASIVFYAWGEPVYVFLMLFSVVFNYVMGIGIANSEDARKAKGNLIFTIVINLFILGFFKYYGFLVESINGVLNTNIGYKELALPIGISFYTFQTLSYIIDVYCGRVNVQKNILNFGLYVTMFPQLIAGPIVRYIDIEKQLENRSVSMMKFGLGAEYFIKGLAKKVLLANNMGLIFDAAYKLLGVDLSAGMAWLGMIAYTFQIYFDFSGYSDMAIGLGKMFGFDFMKNFDYPYQADSITDFWRKWHISLSGWFREYVYIPLGGNRVSVLKHIRNILVVWCLTGLWHGASWNFVAWGLYYGLLLLFEKYVLSRFMEKWPGIIKRIYSIVLVIIGWVLFSCNTLTEALHMLGTMFGIGASGFVDGTMFYYLKSNFILLVIAAFCCRRQSYMMYKQFASKKPILALITNVLLLVLCIAFLVYSSYNPFLYFRF